LSGWHRTSRHDRGYGSAWEKIREQALERDRGLCQHCLAEGRSVPATQVDHVIAKAKGGTDDLGNLQSLCRDHHEAKTAAENGRAVKPKTRFGVDGWPVGE